MAFSFIALIIGGFLLIGLVVLVVVLVQHTIKGVRETRDREPGDRLD